MICWRRCGITWRSPECMFTAACREIQLRQPVVKATKLNIVAASLLVICLPAKIPLLCDRSNSLYLMPMLVSTATRSPRVSCPTTTRQLCCVTAARHSKTSAIRSTRASSKSSNSTSDVNTLVTCSGSLCHQYNLRRYRACTCRCLCLFRTICFPTILFVYCFVSVPVFRPC